MVLAQAQSARCFATDAEHVYWKNANGLVVGAPKIGGDLQVSHFQTPLANDALCGLVVDGSTIFATAYELGKLIEVGLAFDGEWVIGTGGALYGAFEGPSSIAVDDAWVYVTEYDGGRVTKVSRADSSITEVLASGLARPDGIALDQGNVYWINRGSPSIGAGGEGGGASVEGSVMRVAKEGGDAVELAAVLSSPQSLTLHGGRLYWTMVDGTISAMETDGANRFVLAALEFAPGPIAADDETLFWGAAAVRAAALPAGRPFTLYESGYPVALAVDDERVYWADADEVWAGLKSPTAVAH